LKFHVKEKNRKRGRKKNEGRGRTAKGERGGNEAGEGERVPLAGDP